MMNRDKTTNSFYYRDTLEQLFSATVNQSTLGYATVLMASVSKYDPKYHAECIEILDLAAKLASGHDPFLIKCINKSGYFADDFEEAAEIVNDLTEKYLTEYRKPNHGPDA